MTGSLAEKQIEDPTLEVGGAEPLDSTLVPENDATIAMGSTPVARDPTKTERPTQEDATYQAFLRKIEQKAGAPEDQAVNTTGSAKEEKTISQPQEGGFLKGHALKLVQCGHLDERTAVSVALRAREKGTTFFTALSRESSVSGNAAIYRAIAEDNDLHFFSSHSDLLESFKEVPWLDLETIERTGALLVELENGEVAYAAIDPFDLLLCDWISRKYGAAIKPAVVLPTAFMDTLTNLKARIDAPQTRDQHLVPIDVSWQEEKKLLSTPDTSDVPLIVNYILQQCHGEGASDVHLEPTEDALVVRARVDGMLFEQNRFPLGLHPAVVSRIKILSKMDVAERRRPQDGRIQVVVHDSPIDVRVSTLPTVLGEKVVMRLLDDKALRSSPEQLGLRDKNLHLILDKITAPHGLILISGPTGSGKTTTLYSCLSATDRAKRNVLTVEDPVEYRLSGVHQMQTNEKIGLTFATGLRTILRQDPDVIMVGECRDAETARIAVQAALTGHVVFSTIHANDSIGVISRLLDMKIDSYLVASALKLSISQRLVRTTCKHCTVVVEGRDVLRSLLAEGISQEKLARMGIEIDDKMPCSQPRGCDQCRNTGYRGRQAVFEMLELSEEMRGLIVSEKFDMDALRTTADRSGLMPMQADALRLVEEGKTTYSEVVRVLGDK